jgi:hypothetical protein
LPESRSEGSTGLIKEGKMNMTVIHSHQTEPRAGFPYDSFEDIPIYDQRYLPRWETSNKVYYRKKDENLFVATNTKDLTVAGVSMYTDGNLRVNDRLKMKIHLSTDTSFQVDGIVLWRKIRPDCNYAGVIFGSLDAGIQDLISEYAFIPKVYCTGTEKLAEELF